MSGTIKKQEFETLLPWYVKGTLTEKEKVQVEKFLEENPEFTSQIELAQEELDEVIYSNECAGQPSSGALDKLLGDIQNEPSTRKSGLKKNSFFSGLFSNFDFGLAGFALPAALAVIVMQAVALGVVLQQNPDSSVRYETASKKTGEKKLSGSFAFVLFAPTASVEDISSLLNKFNAQIIEGPRSNKMYRVKLSDQKLSEEDLGKIIASLKSEAKTVKLVLPAK